MQYLLLSVMKRRLTFLTSSPSFTNLSMCYLLRVFQEPTVSESPGTQSPGSIRGWFVSAGCDLLRGTSVPLRSSHCEHRRDKSASYFTHVAFSRNAFMSFHPVDLHSEEPFMFKVFTSAKSLMTHMPGVECSHGVLCSLYARPWQGLPSLSLNISTLFLCALVADISPMVFPRAFCTLPAVTPLNHMAHGHM